MSAGYTAPRAVRRAQARLGLLMAAPLLLMMVVFVLFPMLNAVYYALVDFDGLDPSPPWVGLANFSELVRDNAVWAAFRNNVIWIVVGTVAPMAIGTLLALMVWDTRRSSIFYRFAFFLPYILPQVAVAVVWTWIYSPTRGWLNRALEGVGLGSIATGWLGDPDTALYAVLGTAVWLTFGFVFIVLLSALRNVDVDLVDAARLDGANAAQRVRYVVLPQIMPVFLMISAITLFGGFSVFDLIFIMTGGGPANSSEVLGTYAYSSAFELSRFSYGTALALAIAVLAVPFAVGLNRLQRRLSLEGMGA